MLSIIIPSYNEEGNVAKCASVVSKLLSENGIDYELVFVNDGSKDRTWDIISNLARNDEHIVGVNFSRNFGKESAIFAGLETAKGDACVLLDCDLQFPPEVIIEMYNIWKNNDVDIVEGRKNSRGKENPVYKFFSLWFYKMINKSSGLDMEAASDFKLLDRAVVDSLNAMPERLTFFRAMSSWVGYKTERVYFDVADRGAFQIRHKQHNLFYLCAFADSDSMRCYNVYFLCHTGTSYPYQKAYRCVGGRIFNGHNLAASHIEYNNVQSWNNRLLSLKDIRGDKTAT